VNNIVLEPRDFVKWVHWYYMAVFVTFKRN